MLFYFFYYDLPFINTTQKTLKPSKKMFKCPGWMRKNFIPSNFSWRVEAETRDVSSFKKDLLEKQQCSKHLGHIATEKDSLSELKRCIFQISLKYIKVFQKYSLDWYYAVSIFTSKLRDTSQ